MRRRRTKHVSLSVRTGAAFAALVVIVLASQACVAEVATPDSLSARAGSTRASSRSLFSRRRVL